MEKMSYKTFIWPQNPSYYEEKLTRDPIYVTVEGERVFDCMGDEKRVITGSGTFWGTEAYVNYLKLEKLLESRLPGNLRHPLLGNRYCYFTGLELTQEPKENTVHYKFTFTQCSLDGTIPC